MKQRPPKVLLKEKLADWSAAYLAMWKALEIFDPQADLWSEPTAFGTREQRIQAAENAIARAQHRHGKASEPGKEQDVQTFHDCIHRLSSGIPYGSEEAEFARRIREIGSSLADQSVVSANIAEQ